MTTGSLMKTKNDLPPHRREALVGLLNAQLADAIDLMLQAKQAHWNVKGPNFLGLHTLFDSVHAEVGTHVDLLAERVAQLGGVAEGTARAVADRSRLDEYPRDIADGYRHADAISSALAAFGGSSRMAIDEADALSDAITADVFTEVARGSDKLLWLVESHLAGGG